MDFAMASMDQRNCCYERKSKRFDTNTLKQNVKIHDKRVIDYSIDFFRKHFNVSKKYFVINKKIQLKKNESIDIKVGEIHRLENKTKKDPVLVVVQLSGGNDFLNTVIPFTNGIYYDVRSYVGHKEGESLPFTDELAFHPNAEPFREIYNQGKMAIVQGIGYENSSRSHFRAMDIWHTCEPNAVATEGWLAKVIREIDPNSSNPLTAVSFGKGLPRALAAPGVIATSVDNLDNYGLMTSIEDNTQRMANLEVFSRMYTPADEWMGGRHESGVVMNYLANTGSGVLQGADMLKDVPSKYKSSVEYADNSIAKALRDVVRVHTAGFGT